MNNIDFKPLEFERFKNEAGYNYFILSPQKWAEKTNARGIISKSGRYGGTFAHKDIAFEFASWISPEFKLYLITEFQRLKAEENNDKQLDWTQQKGYIYADEADLLNIALFGQTAKQWRDKNSTTKGTAKKLGQA